MCWDKSIGDIIKLYVRTKIIFHRMFLAISLEDPDPVSSMTNNKKFYEIGLCRMLSQMTASTSQSYQRCIQRRSWKTLYRRNLFVITRCLSLLLLCYSSTMASISIINNLYNMSLVTKIISNLSCTFFLPSFIFFCLLLRVTRWSYGELASRPP